MYLRANFHDRNKIRGGKVALDSLFSLLVFCSTAPKNHEFRHVLALSLSLFLSLAVYGEGKISNELKKVSITSRDVFK